MIRDIMTAMGCDRRAHYGNVEQPFCGTHGHYGQWPCPDAARVAAALTAAGFGLVADAGAKALEAAAPHLLARAKADALEEAAAEVTLWNKAGADDDITQQETINWLRACAAKYRPTP